MRAGRLGQPVSCSQWQTMGGCIIGKPKCIPAYRLAVHRTNACPAWQPHSPCVCNLHFACTASWQTKMPPVAAIRMRKQGRNAVGTSEFVCTCTWDAAPGAGPAALLWFQLELKPQHSLPLVVAAGSNAGVRAEGVTGTAPARLPAQPGRLSPEVTRHVWAPSLIQSTQG